MGDLCRSASTVRKTMFGGYAVKAEKLSLFNICYCHTVRTKA